MKNNSKFAVVDLEAIDTFSNGGKIIQVAITMVENWKITDSFSTFVNPGEQVPARITDLTDITDENVKDAPYFEEIAQRIYEKLKDTVFVAHNVNFDFNYLNGEFARAKMPKLKNQRIDTIELTKLFFPEFEKYSLAQLTEELDIPLGHNHFANLDALATAQLLIKIYEHAQSLPTKTIASIKKLNLQMIGETSEFLKLIVGNKDANENFDLYKGAILVNKEVDTERQISKEPVIDDIGLSTDLRIAERQLELADLLFENKQKEISVITRNRFGKTNAALFYSTQAALRKERTLIVVRDKRAITHTKKKWNEVFAKYVSGDVFGEFPTANEFIDLDYFIKVLKRKESGGIQLIKARVLIWLLQTKFGLFSEFKSTEMSSLSDQIASNEIDETNDFFEYYIKNYDVPFISVVQVESIKYLKLDQFDNFILMGDFEIENISSDKNVIKIQKNEEKQKQWYVFKNTVK